MAAIFTSNEVLIPNVSVDIKTGEYHTLSNNSPVRAVQSGSLKSDHLLVNLDEVSISWEISNADEVGSRGERATTIFQELRRLSKNQESYSLLTKHHYYPSVVITNITAQNTGTFNGRIIGTTSFREYNESSLAEVSLHKDTLKKGNGSGDPRSGNTSATAGAPTDAGRVETKSLAQQLLGGFGLE